MEDGLCGGHAGFACAPLPLRTVYWKPSGFAALTVCAIRQASLGSAVQQR
jgi:hypothetical protein